MAERGLDPVAKKTVLRLITYGLYAVTAADGVERGVFTANWLTQVSFEPPLLALSIEKESSTRPLIERSGLFAVCPLSSDQRGLAGDLGRPKARVGDKYMTYGLSVRSSATGVPILAEALGYVVCRVREKVDAGDSILFIGEIIEAAVLADGEPLTMRAAGFRHAG